MTTCRMAEGPGIDMNDDWIKAAENFVADQEGLRLEPYLDKAGNFTIGYGHRCTKSSGAIVEAVARKLLRDDVVAAAAALDGLKLSKNQFVALVSLVFNIGRGAFNQSTLKKRLIAGDLKAAAGQFGRWIYVRKGAEMVVSEGLTARRNRERNLFEREGVMKEVVLQRLKEPSTWRGFGGLLVALGLASAGSVDAILAIGAAIMSAVEVFRSEK